jgi:hypothetical protein
VRNSEYLKKSKYNTAMSIYIGGSAAPVIRQEPERKPVVRIEPEEKRRKNTRTAARAAELARRKKAQKRKAIFTAGGILAAFGVLIGMVLIMLTASVRNSELSREIRNLEYELSEIRVKNDSTAFDISKSVDLNTIIKSASEDLGMVRSSTDQVVLFKAADSEYIKQVANLSMDD